MMIPAHSEKHVSQRGLFDILKKKDISKQSASIVGMFARLSCAEGVPSVFEPPEGHYLELEQVCAYCIFTHTHTYISSYTLYFVISCSLSLPFPPSSVSPTIPTSPALRVS
jgi:hypothetical protein